MSRVAALLLVGLLFVPASAKVLCDVRKQFDTPEPYRQQGSVGACHDFSAIAVLEAALFRQTGILLPLSEADLFVHNNVLTPKYYSAYPNVAEGSHVEADLRYAIANGVATAATVPYNEAIKRRYERFREQTMADMQRDARQEAERAKRANRLEQAFYNQFFAQSYETLNQPARPVNKRLLESPRESQAAAERAFIQSYIQHFEVRDATFTSHQATSEDACLKLGQAQKEAIRAEICDHKRPVAVSMDISGLAGFDSAKSPGYHAFVVTAVNIGEESKQLYFSVRNTTSVDPGLSERQLCRIYRVTTVATPRDGDVANANDQEPDPAQLYKLPGAKSPPYEYQPVK